MVESRCAITIEVRPRSAVSKRLLNGRLGLGIEMRCRLVEDDDVGAFQQQARNGQPLLLAAGKAIAALANQRIEPVRQGLNQRQNLCGAQ